MLACQSLALWFMMVACGIELPLWAGAVVLLVIRLGTAIPNAPANVGSFQVFSVLALNRLFGVGKTVTAGFLISCFVALTVPLWIIGLLAFSRRHDLGHNPIGSRQHFRTRGTRAIGLEEDLS